MKIVNCALLYADGDKYVWSVVTEDASEFPIDMDLVADGSIWENDGVKSVLTDGEWVAESSGGGVSLAEVTFISSSGEYSVERFITPDIDGFLNTVTVVATADEPATVSVPLYNGGKARIYAEQFSGIGADLPTVTGDITFANTYFEVSGNGTITATGTTT